VKRPHFFILIAACLPAFVGAAWLSGSGLFLSPDETANAFFAKSFAAGNGLSFAEPSNAPLRGIIHPRSMVAAGEELVPGGFVGLPAILGMMARLFGTAVLPFLVPLIAALAVFAVHRILRRLGSERFAVVGASLLAIHPAWWYYASRGFMPNVLFASLVIFAAFFLVVRPFHHGHSFALRLKQIFRRASLHPFVSRLNIVCAGLSLGLALFVRTSEVVWLLSAFALGTWMICRKIAWRSVFIFCAAALAAVSPFFYFNATLYGSSFQNGYTYEDVSGRPDAAVLMDSSLRERVERALSPLFPFGIHPRAVLRTWAQNAVDLYPLLAALVFIGIHAARLEKSQDEPEQKKRWRALLWVALLVTGWLAVMYGSWIIHDNPDPAAVTIGNSYARYWLPMFLLWTPFAARGIFYAGASAPKRWEPMIVGCLVSACAIFSVQTVVFTNGDGLRDAVSALERNADIRKIVLQMTEPDAILIVDRADKIFFPARRVVQPLRSETTYAAMPDLAARAPLYYYGITFPPQDVQYLNEKKLAERGLKIEKMESFGIESLYRITSAGN